jgi:hypothetical protein
MSVNVVKWAKQITWGDGSKEIWMLDRDGYFWIDGVRRKLIGFVDAAQFPSGNQWDAANLTLVDTQLTNQQSKGVRIWEVAIAYKGSANQQATYNSVMQLAYNHKMIVLPLFTVRGTTNFNTLIGTNFILPPSNEQTVTQWLIEFIGVMNGWQNVATLILENEIDVYYGAQNFSAGNAWKHIDLIFKTARPLTNLPLVTKLDFYGDSATQAAISDEIAKYSDIMYHDLYGASAGDFTTVANACNSYRNQLRNKPSQMWVTETNYRSGGVFDATKLTKAMIDAQFAANASLVMLFDMYGNASVGTNFFDSAGAPIANTDTLMANVAG